MLLLIYLYRVAKKTHTLSPCLMAEWEEKTGELQVTHALIFEAKQQKGPDGMNWFKPFSLQLSPGIKSHHSKTL